MTTVVKRAAARPGAPAASRRAGGAGFEVLRFEKRRAPGEVERIPLFEIDGVEYSMAAVVEAADAIGLSQLLAVQRSELIKQIVLLREVLGRPALDALLTEASFTMAHWRQLVAIVQAHALGPLEEVEAQGN